MIDYLLCAAAVAVRFVLATMLQIASCFKPTSPIGYFFWPEGRVLDTLLEWTHKTLGDGGE
jgi:hypothetical protein